MKIRKQRVVNFFAGPGAGKTAMMFGTAAKCKFMEMNVEINPEYAKINEWEGRIGKIRQAQEYIAAKQHYGLRILDGEVQVVITDGPFLLGHVYAKHSIEPLQSMGPMLDEMFDRYDNLNFFVQRSTEDGKKYMQRGRSQNRSQAMDKDDEVHQMLIDKKIPFQYVQWGEEHVPVVIAAMQARGWIKPWWEQEEEDRAATRTL